LSIPRQITLHVGLHKTGTTLIQRSLRKLRDPMARRGVVYMDRLEMSDMASFAGWRALPSRDDPRIPRLPAHRLHRVELAEQFTLELRHLAERRSEEAAAAAGGHPAHLVMSNEALVGAVAPDLSHPYRPRAEPALQHVLDALAPDSTRLVLYVRRQDRLIESQYVQRIHEGLTHDFEEFAAAATADTFIRYGDLVERLAEIATVVEVTVRPFEVIGLGAVDFMIDFLEPLGLGGLDLSDVSMKRTNPSYTAPALRAALAINPLLETLDELRATRRFLRSTFPIGKYPRPQLFDEKERQRVLDMYAPANRRLFRSFMPEFPEDSYALADGLDPMRRSG